MNAKILQLAVLMAVGTILTSLSAPAREVLPGHVPPAVTRLHLPPLGRLAGTNRLALSIGLPLRNREALNDLLQQLYDPASTNYHRYLTPAQFTERFGPTEADYSAVTAFARRSGLEIVRTRPDRTQLGVRGSVADIERAWHVRLNRYQHPTEHRAFYAPDAEPSVVPDVPILSVGGLNDYVLPRPMNLKASGSRPVRMQAQTGSGPGGNFIGNDFRAAYVPGVALTGAGQTVGLLEFDGYYTNDIASYESLASLSAVPVTNILLDGFPGTSGFAGDEVSLDIEMAISMAPGLDGVVVYEGNIGDDILTEMAAPSQGEPLSLQLSASWTFSTDAATEQIFQRFAAQGQSYFNASGDSDAYGTGADVPTPAGDTNITIVGGTTLTTSGPGGSWQSETTWNWGFNSASDQDVGSSGGITSFGIPAWQQGIDMSTNHGSATLRNIPDVALTADNIWVIYGSGQAGQFGGTSCATPLWAAFTALVNQQAAVYGRPTAGFINPAIYALAEGPLYGTCFHDITTGNNVSLGSPNNYYAVPGYDLCTGWGTPAGLGLIDALAPPDQLVITPYNRFAAAGNPGGPFTVTSQNLSLTNIGTGPLAWSLNNPSVWLDVSTNDGTLLPGGAPATVTVSLAPAAYGLAPGLYTATIWFTNLDDLVGQGRTCTLNILGAPYLTGQPQNQEFDPGFNVPFTVSAGGATPLHYCWQQNGGFITGATNATYTATNVQVSDSGSQFTCVVTNAYGAVTSSPALLLVISPPVIYSFNGPDGLYPFAGLAPGADGNFYGTTYRGGACNSGTVFRMTTNGALTTLYSFDYSDETNGFNKNGGYPLSMLVRGRDGNLYGPAFAGGTNGCGTIFKVTTNGVVSLFATFSEASGHNPQGALLLGADGNFYGTTKNAGPPGYWGNVFKLTAEGQLSNLVSFNVTNGARPLAGLIQGRDGDLYGTTSYGGTNTYGTIFKITTAGALTTVFSFNGANGGFPEAPLIQDGAGNFYGTTASGGDFNAGTVFELTTNNTLTTFVSFNPADAINGNTSETALLPGSDGNFYGTTVTGGAAGRGTLFSLTPGGALTTILTFAGTNGAYPQGALIEGTQGNLYGTTYDGGIGFSDGNYSGNGTVFRLAMPTSPPNVIAQPLSQTVAARNPASLHVSATGSAPLNCQWRFTGTNIPAATNGDYTLASATVAAGGSYDVVVNNDYGSVTSSVASLVVLPPPGALVYGGQSVAFFPSTTGAGHALQMSTDPVSGNWVTVSNGIPFAGLAITNVTGPAFFRLCNVAAIAARIAGGNSDSFLVRNDGSLWAMGDNENGELGDGTYNSTNLPEQIVAGNVTSVAAGYWHTLFIKADGSLWAMGANDSGELGDGTYNNETNLPEQIMASNVVAVAAGNGFGLFLQVDGSLWAMGNNGNGQLGGGNYNDAHRPLQIVSSNVTAIAAGAVHSLFLKHDGSLWAMGDNQYGQLGDGTYVGRGQPEQIVPGGVTAIAGGGAHSLFLKSDGSLWAMGYNGYGELGDGTYNTTNVPEQIVASNVTAIAAGNGHSLFLKSDGSLWGMGWNQRGELGDGTYNNTNLPELIVASNVVAIAGGVIHSLFIKSDGSLWSMGDNSDGELGDGTDNNTNQPEQFFQAGPGILPPALGIGTYGGQPAVLFPIVSTLLNSPIPVLQMSTNLAVDGWVTVSNAVPFTGLEITNTPGPLFFRLF